MPSLRIVGTSPWGDMYPNVKYRVTQIELLPQFQTTTDVVRLSPKDHIDQGVLGYIRYGLQTLKGVLGVAVRARKAKPDLIYVTYPTPVLLVLLRILGAQRHSRIVADLFISISETLINDRAKVRPGSRMAKLILRLERISLRNVVCIVDTDENAHFLSSFLDLPPTQFQACPLALVPEHLPVGLHSVEPPTQEGQSTGPDVSTAYFVGTFVPLQGVPTIAEHYVKAERSVELIPLVLRGNGQDGPQVQKTLTNAPDSRLEWRDSFADAETVEREIAAASVCVGVFGQSNKAGRVIPFKVYQYLRAGRPILTLDGPAIRDLERRFLLTHEGPSPFILVDRSNIAASFVTELAAAPKNNIERAQQAENARACFDLLLSDNVSGKRLVSIFDSTLADPT